MHSSYGEVDAVVVEQHLEHVVGLDRRAGDRAEHSDARGRVAQGVQDAERDRGFARVTFCRRDEDALRHGLSLGRWVCSRPCHRTPGIDVPDHRGRTGLDRTGRDLDRQSAGADRRCRASRGRLARAAQDDARLPGCRRARWSRQQRETYDRGNGATVLLYDRERRTVLLTRQFRFPRLRQRPPRRDADRDARRVCSTTTTPRPRSAARPPRRRASRSASSSTSSTSS